MSISLLVLLVVLLIGSAVVAVGSYQATRRRAEVVTRAGGLTGASAKAVPLIAVPGTKPDLVTRLGEVAERFLPEGSTTTDSVKLLTQAGYQSQSAPAIYSAVRLICAIAIPGAAFAWGPRDSVTMVLISAVVGIGLGLLGPPAMVTRMARLRQDRIRKSIPDSLDLLLVCVEAGVSLDAAILRVGREMMVLHPDLSFEFLTMNRRMNAGMRREDALHGLFDRTGVQELRSLGANMIQSERWGTSIAQVLRVYSEGLRRKRRQAAEKKAALAATKMIFPLALFILPALFAVIGGPAVIGLGSLVDAFGK